MLSCFLQYSKVNQLSPLLFRFFSHIDHYRVPCAIQLVLIIFYFIYNTVQYSLSIQNANLLRKSYKGVTSMFYRTEPTFQAAIILTKNKISSPKLDKQKVYSYKSTVLLKYMWQPGLWVFQILPSSKQILKLKMENILNFTLHANKGIIFVNRIAKEGPGQFAHFYFILIHSI